MDITLETEHLLLKVLNPAYAPQVLEFYDTNRAHFEPWEPQRAINFYSESFQRANLTCEYNEMIKSRFLRYWIFPKDNPERIAGTVCFNNIMNGAFQSCMIGYKISREFCRRGYAGEACGHALEVIYNNYGFHRIEALIHPDNLPSMRLIEKLGFHNEGLSLSCVQIGGCWEDHYRYAKIAPPRRTWQSI